MRSACSDFTVYGFSLAGYFFGVESFWSKFGYFWRGCQSSKLVFFANLKAVKIG